MNTIRYDKKYSKNVLHLYFKIASAMPLCNFRNKLLRIINVCIRKCPQQGTGFIFMKSINHMYLIMNILLKKPVGSWCCKS